MRADPPRAKQADIHPAVPRPFEQYASRFVVWNAMAFDLFRRRGS